MEWQLQEAKQKFSEVVRRAMEEGPQRVTKNGHAAVVVVSAEEYRRLRIEENKRFHEFLMSGPDWSMLDLERKKDNPRDVDLES